MTLEIPYLPDPSGQYLVLLTENERLRHMATLEDLEHMAGAYRKAGLNEDAAAYAHQADQVRQELEIDAELSALPEVQTARIEFRAPILADRARLRTAFTTATPGDLVKAKAVAVECLAPTWPDDQGGTQEIPYRFQGIIEDACYRVIDPDEDLDRRLYWMKRQLTMKVSSLTPSLEKQPIEDEGALGSGGHDDR